MIADDGLEIVEAADRAALSAWFAANFSRRESVWLLRHRKVPGQLFFSYATVVEECLRWGWIDSRPRKLDDRRSLLLLSPRRPGSAWSEINRGIVARLEATGMLTAPGREVVERARADGSWDRLAAVDGLSMPADLVAAFASEPAALAAFEAFPPSARRGILEWIVQARRAETRLQRVAATVAAAREGRRANRWPR